MALALPWLESLIKPAHAVGAAPPKRFMAIFLPNGAPELWKPQAVGSGAAWSLSSVLEPFAALKAKTTVISGLENGSVFNVNGSSDVQPSHGKLAGAWLTCQDSSAIRKLHGNVADANGVSVDQVMAAHAVFAGQTLLPSLQVGLSTVQSYCDGQPCSLARSVSWQTEVQPLYKEVDPVAVFNKLAGVWPTDGATATALAESRKSVLDTVLESAGTVRGRLSAPDKLRLDEYLDSMRAVEKSVAVLSGSGACATPPTKPTFPTVSSGSYTQDGAGYTKGAHADLMNDLLALAFQCDRTRIVSHMLEDERSEYVYNSVPVRTFTAATSTLATGVCGNWHAAQHGPQDPYASIVHWNVGKVAALCQKLSNMPEGTGSVLDNCVIFMGAALHGNNELAADLPALLVGSGGGSLKTDQHLALANRPLRDLYFTLMNGVYGMNINNFGIDRTGGAIASIAALLA